MPNSNNLVQSVHVALINSKQQILCMRGFRQNGDPSTRWMVPGGRILDTTQKHPLIPYHLEALRAKLSQKLGIPSKEMSKIISSFVEVGHFQWDKPRRDERLFTALIQDGTPIEPLSSKIYKLEWMNAQQIAQKRFVSKNFQLSLLKALELYPTLKIPASFKFPEKKLKATSTSKPKKKSKRTKKNSPEPKTVNKPKVQTFPILFTKEGGTTKALLISGFYTPKGKERCPSKKWKLPKITKTQGELFFSRDEIDGGLSEMLGLSENGYILTTFVADKTPYKDREIVLAGELRGQPQISPNHKQISRLGLFSKEEVENTEFTYKRFRKYILTAFEKYERSTLNH